MACFVPDITDVKQQVPCMDVVKRKRSGISLLTESGQEILKTSEVRNITQKSDSSYHDNFLIYGLLS